MFTDFFIVTQIHEQHFCNYITLFIFIVVIHIILAFYWFWLFCQRQIQLEK